MIQVNVGAPDMPVELAIRSVAPRVGGGVVHLALDAEVTPVKR